jgi:AcrR family transcriptional regulator
MSSRREQHSPELYKVSSGGGDPRTRDRILEGTLKLLRAGRGADISMAQVAKAAGISRQAVYLHFSDRAALFVAVARYVDAHRGIEQELETVWNAPDIHAFLHAAAAVGARQNPKVWPIARLIDAIRRNDASAEKAWQDRLHSRLLGARRAIQRLKNDGVLRPGLSVETATDLFWSIVSLRTWEDLVIERGWSAERYTREIREMLLRTLTTVAD